MYSAANVYMNIDLNEQRLFNFFNFSIFGKNNLIVFTYESEFTSIIVMCVRTSVYHSSLHTEV